MTIFKRETQRERHCERERGREGGGGGGGLKRQRQSKLSKKSCHRKIIVFFMEVKVISHFILSHLKQGLGFARFLFVQI